jgi:hypothetical protein
MVITATMAPDQGVYREYCTALMANSVYAAEFASKFQFPHLTEVSCTGRGRPPVHFRDDYFLESVLPDGKYPFICCCRAPVGVVLPSTCIMLLR